MSRLIDRWMDGYADLFSGLCLDVESTGSTKEFTSFGLRVPGLSQGCAGKFLGKLGWRVGLAKYAGFRKQDSGRGLNHYVVAARETMLRVVSLCSVSRRCARCGSKLSLLFAAQEDDCLLNFRVASARSGADQ